MSVKDLSARPNTIVEGGKGPSSLKGWMFALLAHDAAEGALLICSAADGTLDGAFDGTLAAGAISCVDGRERLLRASSTVGFSAWWLFIP